MSEPPAISRRAALAGGVAATLCANRVWAAPEASEVARFVIRDDAPERRISPYVFGSNEIGAMEGGPLSADLDRAAFVTARRLGGNLMSTYDWGSNNSNAGKDWAHENRAFLPEAMRLAPERWDEPAAVIDAMHRASRDMGAVSLVTLPLGDWVAADRAGVVTPGERAPSRRFKPVRWDGRTPVEAPVDGRVCDVPHLLARLVAAYGGAGGAGGIKAYALDNEPDLWSETHPRAVAEKPAIGWMIERSILAARVIKAIDPAALVFGPASWGPTGMATFQDAPDLGKYRSYGSFLDAYLAAFRTASEKAGVRLLDALDVHWYPYSRRGDLMRTEDPALGPALLEAPRSLDEAGFREESWVPGAIGVGRSVGVTLPLLPSLRRIVAERFPDTKIAVTELNYGGGGQVASGLALADALGRFATGGVFFAAHWGALSSCLGAAYRLYRTPGPGAFEGQALGVEGRGGAVRLHAARRADGTASIVAINTSEKPARIEIVLPTKGGARVSETIGFGAGAPDVAPLAEPSELAEGAFLSEIPARSGRRYAVA